MIYRNNEAYKPENILETATKWSQKDYKAIRKPGFQNILVAVLIQTAWKKHENNNGEFEL